MKTKQYLLIALFVLTLGFLSCGKGEFANFTPGTSTPDIVDQNRDRFAKALALAIDDSDFLNFIIEEAKKEFMGDRDILYAQLKDKEIPGTRKPVYLFLAQTERKVLPSREMVSFFKKDVLLTNPGLNIYLFIPEEMLDSDDLKVTKVSYLPENYDESTTAEIPYYDLSGGKSLIAAKEDPTEPVLVVKENERVLAVHEESGTTKYGNAPSLDNSAPDFTVDRIAYYDINNLLEPTTERIEGITEDTMCFEQCPNADRHTRNNREEVVKVKFVNRAALNSVCPWHDGRPEIQVIWVGFTNLNSPSADRHYKTFKDKRRKFIQGGNTIWYYFPAPLLFQKFNRTIYGDPVIMKWVEIDNTDFNSEITLNSPTLSFEISEDIGLEWQPLSYTIKWNAQNDDIGEDIIYFCDPANNEGTLYNTGTMLFHMKEQE